MIEFATGREKKNLQPFYHALRVVYDDCSVSEAEDSLSARLENQRQHSEEAGVSYLSLPWPSQQLALSRDTVMAPHCYIYQVTNLLDLFRCVIGDVQCASDRVLPRFRARCPGDIVATIAEPE